MIRSSLLVLAAALLAAGCANDCDALCEKQNECLGLTDEDSQLLCVEQCNRDMEEDSKADEIEACTACFESHDCEELFPADGAVGVCAADC